MQVRGIHKDNRYLTSSDVSRVWQLGNVQWVQFGLGTSLKTKQIKRTCHRKIAVKEGHMVTKCRKHKNTILSLKSFCHYQKERPKNFMREPNYFSFFIEPWKFWSIFLVILVSNRDLSIYRNFERLFAMKTF